MANRIKSLGSNPSDPATFAQVKTSMESSLASSATKKKRMKIEDNIPEVSKLLLAGAGPKDIAKRFGLSDRQTFRLIAAARQAMAVKPTDLDPEILAGESLATLAQVRAVAMRTMLSANADEKARNDASKIVLQCEQLKSEFLQKVIGAYNEATKKRFAEGVSTVQPDRPASWVDLPEVDSILDFYSDYLMEVGLNRQRQRAAGVPEEELSMEPYSECSIPIPANVMCLLDRLSERRLREMDAEESTLDTEVAA